MQSTKYFSCLTLACVAVLIFYASPSMACYCQYAHPQDVFCESAYVILAQVLEKSVILNKISYKLNIRYSFSMTSLGQKILEKKVLDTELDSCSVSLQVGESYVIADNSTTLYGCSYVRRLEDIPLTELIGFSGGYKYRRGCNCKARSCDNTSSNSVSDNKVCLPSRDSNNRCRWFQLILPEK